MITYEFPLAEVIYDFYDKLKSISKGYAPWITRSPVFSPATS